MPDLLAVLRALAGLAIFVALSSDGRGLALVLFSVAALSDALDGWLARRSHIATEHGALLDPLADKALVVMTLAGLALVRAVPLELAAAIAMRELVVTALRVRRYRAGEHPPTSSTAKLKTALELCGLAVLIVARPPAPLAAVGVALLAAALVIGLATLPAYLPHHRQVRSAGGR